MTLVHEGECHFVALFRFHDNNWIKYDGMKDPTCKELDLSSVNRDVAWLVYVDMEYMKENMKSLKREMDQLLDTMPGKYWTETPHRNKKD